MKTQRRFSAWHVFVTFFALFLCLQMLTVVGGLMQLPAVGGWAVAAAFTAMVFLGGGALYLVRELWAEFRRLENPRRERRR